MATVIVNIPDGEFCSDKHYLDCKFASHQKWNTLLPFAWSIS